MQALLLLPTLLFASPSVDVRVDGEGYLRFVREGRVVYAKAAPLAVVGGKVCHAAGPSVLPSIYAPDRSESLSVDLEGNVSAVVDGTRTVLGRLVLALFPKGMALTSSDGMLISADRPTLGEPGADTCGVVRMGNPVPIGTGTGSASTPKPGSPVPTPASGSGNVTVTDRGAVVTLAASSEVASDAILLGEVARIEAPAELGARLAAVSLGVTPPIGVPRILDRERILTCLRAAKIEVAEVVLSVPLKVEVRRRSAIVTHQEFVDAAIAYTQEQLGTHATLKNLDTLPDMPIAEGPRELRCDNLIQNGTGVQVVVSVMVAGRPFRSRTIRLGADYGEAGVRQGDSVKVVLRSGGAVIEVTGYARKTAFLGQSVEVEIRGGQRTTHTGIVTAPGVVEVKL